MADLEQVRSETERVLSADTREALDLAYITEDVVEEIDAAEEPGADVLADYEGAEALEGGEPPEQPPGTEALQIIYGHSLVVIGAAHYFKLVQSGTWRCLATSYYRWPSVAGRQWVGTCSPGNGKWQLSRWV